MHVVAHQCVAVDIAGTGVGGLTQKVEVTDAVLVVVKDFAPIVPTLSNVHRKPGTKQTEFSGHPLRVISSKAQIDLEIWGLTP